MSKKILVVVDVQKDFYHPDGALYVKGGEVLPERIAKVIPEFDNVIFTLDWHPANHCSFADNGGIWPVHCVAYTEGASLPKEFIPFLVFDGNPVGRNYNNIVTKGSWAPAEEYGAHIPIYLLDCIDEVVFCGIAGDYCVKETLKNFLETFDIKASVYLDGIVSIDDGTTLRKFMEENNIGEWKPEE